MQLSLGSLFPFQFQSDVNCVHERTGRRDYIFTLKNYLKQKMLRDRLRAANGAEGHKNNPHTAMNNSNVNASVFRRRKED